MEVHTHSHLASGETHTARKKWTHYFWEFFMLFAAVFCGFLAENFREHQVEHRREKQYMESLVKDLTADTVVLNEGLPRKEERIIAIDSLFDYFYLHKDQNKIPVYVHNLMRRSSWDRNYDRNQTTMSQLKSSGNLRLIRKRNVADSLLSYDFAWERADNYYHETYWKVSGEINDYIKKMISDYSLLPYYKANQTIAARLPDELNLDIQINTTYLLEYLNHLHKTKATIRQDKDFYTDIEKRAERLIELIQKEYHLK